MRWMTIAALAAAATGCDQPGGHLSSSQTRIFLHGNGATTTLTTTAARVCCGHGDNESFPRTGLEMFGGPSPGELLALPEISPGIYSTTIDGAYPAYQYSLEGVPYVHEAPPVYTATAALVAVDPPTVLINWDPPLGRFPDDRMQLAVDSPTRRWTTIDCGLGQYLSAEESDRIEVPGCAFRESGPYTLTLTRIRGTVGDDDNGEFLYSPAMQAELALSIIIP